MNQSMQHNALNYMNYLRIDELLSLQTLLSKHHDETLFIIIHQVYELWFKQVLHEMGEVIRCFEAGDVPRSIKVVHRILAIQKVMVTQIDVLETMTPTEFAEFRDRLRPASGFQSLQFREVEFLCGLKNPNMLAPFSTMAESLEKLQARLNAPTLYDHFIRMLAQKGFPIDENVLNRDVTKLYEENDSVLQAIKTIYQETHQYFELYMLCEALLSLEENFSLWRFRHLKMVERTIGAKTGTGGSSGAKYLASTMSSQFFPELWSVRNLIGTY